MTWLIWVAAALVLAGVALLAWGWAGRSRARRERGTMGGFGGPPGTHDIGTQIGLGTSGEGGRPVTGYAGRGAIQAGLTLAVVGVVLLVAVLVWRAVG